MNRLPPAGEDRWRLPRHAHLVVYEAGRFRDGDGRDGRDGGVTGGSGGNGAGGSSGDGGSKSGGDGGSKSGGDGGSKSGGDGDGTGGSDNRADGRGGTDAGPDELVTVYDCGAAQKPPSAQFIGHLVRVRADADVARTETGYVVRMRAPAVLEKQGERRWVVAER